MLKLINRFTGINSYLADASWILLAVTVLTLSLVWFRLDISVTIILLFGIWILDAFIKKSYEFGNETVFADFSFASFVFVVGQEIARISNSPADITDTKSAIWVITLMFILFLLWLGNLRICRDLINREGLRGEATKSNLGNWFTSIGFSFLSACFVLVPQALGVI